MLKCFEIKLQDTKEKEEKQMTSERSIIRLISDFPSPAVDTR